MKKFVISLLACVVLSGCSSPAKRMAECESQGISRDTCYLSEQNRQQSINNAAMSAAYRNAASQHAQAAHKNNKHEVSYKQLTNEAESVINGTISDGAEFLLAQGWKPNNGVWKKQGYTLTLIVQDNIVMNAQLTK